MTQQTIELQQRLRDLEILVIDVKAQAERKIQQMMEELPNKLEREMKRIEQKDA